MQTYLGSFIHNLIDSRYSFANVALYIFIKSHRVKERIDDYILRPPFDSDHPHMLSCHVDMQCLESLHNLELLHRENQGKKSRIFFTEWRTNASIWLKLGDLKSAQYRVCGKKNEETSFTLKPWIK